MSSSLKECLFFIFLETVDSFLLKWHDKHEVYYHHLSGLRSWDIPEAKMSTFYQQVISIKVIFF